MPNSISKFLNTKVSQLERSSFIEPSNHEDETSKLGEAIKQLVTLKDIIP